MTRRLMTLETDKRSLKTNTGRAGANAEKYRLLLSQLIALVDTRRCAELKIEDVMLHARSGAIAILLGELFQHTGSFNVFTLDDWKLFNDEIARMANAAEPPHKITVANKGIALLMTWAVEGIRQQV
ncbi:MAG: hypothetical protein ACXWLX_09140 [Rhizomicrobium sp.]